MGDRYVPTLHFRWVTREVIDSLTVAHRQKFLQQGWAPASGGFIEWRDVPAAPSCNCTAYCSQCMPAQDPNPQPERKT